MNRIEIVKTGDASAKVYWALLRNRNNEYGTISTTDKLEPQEADIDNKLYQAIQWLSFEKTSHLDLTTKKTKAFTAEILF